MKFSTPQTLITLLLVFFVNATTFGQKEKERIARYVEQYKHLAVAEMLRTGVPASITLAQGVLETGNGQSDLALYANNHFGIKCKAGWTGETVLHDDDQKGECFRKYISVEESYRDHSDFLRSRSNYASLFLINPEDYAGWAIGLKRAGYATNPTYAERLTKIIEENGLQEYTLYALQQQKNKPGELFANTQGSSENQTGISMQTPANVSLASVQQLNEISSKPRNILYPSGPFVINGTKVIFAETGTSLLAIANNHRVTYNKLIEFNDLDNNDILEQSQLVYLEKKPKKGVNEFHTVEPNETLHEICQKECVQLASVMEFNHLQKGMKPAVGEKLYLKVKAGTSPKLAVQINTSATSM